MEDETFGTPAAVPVDGPAARVSGERQTNKQTNKQTNSRT